MTTVSLADFGDFSRAREEFHEASWLFFDPKRS